MLVPGAAIVRGLDLGRDRLERFVLAAAFGRIAFAAVTLASVGALGRPLPWLAVALGGVGWAAAARRAPRAALRPLARADALAVAAALAAAALLAAAIVARSGLPDASGALVFYGRDASVDPIVYAAASRQLVEAGLPLTHPFAAGSPATGHYVHLAMPAAVAALGLGNLVDVLFRALPLFDLALAGIAAACVARALGGGALAVASAPLWLLLAAEPSFLLPPLAPLFGGVGRRIDTWAFFGPYLLPFNPITPGLHALFAALLLVLGAPARRTAALAAGVLVGSLFETKLFLWAPAIAGLGAAAWIAPPREAARPLRLAFGAALLASLPSLVEKALASARYAGVEEIGFRLCPGCLPRYLVGATWLGGDLGFAAFRDFQSAQLLAPRAAAGALLASAVTLAVVLGARAAALPELWRGLRADPALPAAGVAVRRWLAAASALGLGAGCTVVVAPHYLNGAQFAWIACYGLAPLVAVQAGRWAASRRGAALAAVVFLAVPSSLDVLLRLGWSAPRSLVVSRAEQELMDALARAGRPGDTVLEPSMLIDTDVPSPAPWLAGRAVHLSLLSTVQVLPRAEQERRLGHVAALFGERDREAAGAALRESGAAFVYAPAAWPLRVDPAGLLTPLAANAAGTLYRVTR